MQTPVTILQPQWETFNCVSIWQVQTVITILLSDFSICTFLTFAPTNPVQQLQSTWKTIWFCSVLQKRKWFALVILSTLFLPLSPPPAPPMIRLSVNDTVVVDPGQDVLLTCEVTAGFPFPTVIWSRNPGPLPLSAQVRGATLILRAVTPADAGFYNCSAVNNVGNPARKNANLVVRSKWCMCVSLFVHRKQRDTR